MAFNVRRFTIPRSEFAKPKAPQRTQQNVLLAGVALLNSSFRSFSLTARFYFIPCTSLINRPNSESMNSSSFHQIHSLDVITTPIA